MEHGPICPMCLLHRGWLRSDDEMVFPRLPADQAGAGLFVRWSGRGRLLLLRRADRSPWLLRGGPVSARSLIAISWVLASVPLARRSRRGIRRRRRVGCRRLRCGRGFLFLRACRVCGNAVLPSLRRVRRRPRRRTMLAAPVGLRAVPEARVSITDLDGRRKLHLQRSRRRRSPRRLPLTRKRGGCRRGHDRGRGRGRGRASRAGTLRRAAIGAGRASTRRPCRGGTRTGSSRRG
jgi:hypothetical protein